MHPLIAILLVKLCFWLTVVTHQIMHALACIHAKRRVREFGFTMLHGFIPTFYVDVTDVFMANRRARIMNALAGPLVHLFLASLYLWTASLAGPGLVKGFLAASAILQLQSFFVSLYPFCFLEMDGYHILADLLGMPNAHPRLGGVSCATTLWSRISSRARPEPAGDRLRRLLRALRRLDRRLRGPERLGAGPRRSQLVDRLPHAVPEATSVTSRPIDAESGGGSSRRSARCWSSSLDLFEAHLSA